MIVRRSLDELLLSNTAVAIGVFDGVHLGHQQILNRARLRAGELRNAQSVAVTFDRHPTELLAPISAPRCLTSLSQRLELIEKYCSVDVALVVPFDEWFSNLSSTEFVSNILVQKLGARHVLVGDDFRYGKGRTGDVTDLRSAGQLLGFDVDVLPSVVEDGERVSSTRIRSLISHGEIHSAEHLLGHRFAIRGTVVAGKKLGRTIGYPTANVSPEHPLQLLPENGVYAAWVNLLTKQGTPAVWPAAVSVGINPTTDQFSGSPKIEAYIMGGFDNDIYGSVIDVEFVHRLRPELKFDSIESLKYQIAADVARTQILLAAGTA